MATPEQRSDLASAPRHTDQREGGKHCRHRHHGVSRSAKARQWVGAKLEHPRASWGLSSITWRYKRRRRPQGHSEDGHGPEMDRREDPNVNYLPAFATQRQREGAHQPGQAGQSHSSPSLLISPATTSGLEPPGSRSTRMAERRRPERAFNPSSKNHRKGGHERRHDPSEWTCARTQDRWPRLIEHHAHPTTRSGRKGRA